MPRKQRFKPSRKPRPLVGNTLVERSVELPPEEPREAPSEPQATNPE